MRKYLVDTNIPSELTYPRPEPLVAAFLRQSGRENLYVSSLTFGEICKGIGSTNGPAQNGRGIKRAPQRAAGSFHCLGARIRVLCTLDAGAKRTNLQAWLDSALREWFAGRSLPVTVPTAERWGFMSADAKRRGRPLSVLDGLLAATALEHDLTMVTRNVKDFADLGVTLLNPWKTS